MEPALHRGNDFGDDGIEAPPYGRNVSEGLNGRCRCGRKALVVNFRSRFIARLAATLRRGGSHLSCLGVARSDPIRDELIYLFL